MTDRDDRILDACLDELLAGQTPPDLSDRILQALATGQPPGQTNRSNAAGPAQRTITPIILSPANDKAVPAAVGTSTRAHRTAWLIAAVAASLLAAFVSYRLFHPAADNDPQRRVARSTPQPPAVQQASPQANMEKPADEPVPEAPAQAATPAPRVNEQPVPGATAAPVKPEAVANTPAPSVDPKPAEPASLLPASASRSDEEVIAQINAYIRRGWEEAGIKPAAAATDSEWCRRVYLDIVGRIPTLEEINRFLADRRPQKRLRLVEHLLDSDEGIEEYARNWTNIWTALLIGRSSSQGSLAHREGMQQYLRRSFLRNKPYDEFVSELISADGANTPGAADFHGAVNFLLDNLQENAVPATAKTARLFLGMQLQCTQCHNHPFNDWKQDQFWQLNSFFRQAKAQTEREGNRIVVTKLVDVDFAGESGKSPHEAEVYWEMRNGLLKASYPTFVDGTPIDPSGDVERVNRRDELARLVVRSREMPRAIVNRMWGHFLGYGFTRPVDDMGPHNPPSHPELLELLADEMRTHGYDVKRLIRWIVLSEPYALSSRIPPATEKSGKDDPAAGTRPLFSYFYLRQMRAEELYESLLALAGRREGGSFEERERAKTQWLQQFNASYNTEENDEYTTFNGSITQTLAMFNGELTRAAVNLEGGTFLRRVATSSDQSAAKIGQLFTAALARKPTKQELQLAHQLWLERKEDGAAALQDIWWAVLNSNEFLMNH